MKTFLLLDCKLLITIITLLFFSIACKKQKDKAPNIETVAISDVNCHSACSGGKIKLNSDLNILQKGVCYSNSSNPDTNDMITNNGDGTASFVSFISGLEISTKYFVRAYIISSFGIEYGEEFNFTTSSCDSFIYGGKTYHAIQIGNQCWMTENLTIGTTIHGNQNQLNNGIIEQYAYNNLALNHQYYGGLYQWSELLSYAPGSNSNPSGVEGIAPHGWHIPSDSEWQELELFLGMNNSDVQSTGWRGMVGILLKPGGSSGFKAKCGGRIIGGVFNDINYYGYYWTSTKANQSDAWYRIIDCNSALIKRDVEGIHHGMSVRCVKD